MKKFKKILFATLITIVVLSVTVISSFADSRPSSGFNYFTFGVDELIIKNQSHGEIGIYSFDKVLGSDLRQYFANNPTVDNVVFKDRLSGYNWETNNKASNIDCHHNVTPITTPSSYLRDTFSVELYEDDTYIYNDFSARYSDFIVNLNTTNQYLPLFSISCDPYSTNGIPTNTLSDFYTDFTKSCPVTFFYYSNDGSIKRLDSSLVSFPKYDTYGTMNYYCKFDDLLITDIYTDSTGYAYINSMFVYSSGGQVLESEYEDCSVNFFSYVGDTHSFYINNADDNFYTLASNDIRIFDTTYLTTLINSDLVQPSDFNFWTLMTSAIGGFFEFEIFPGLSFGGIGLACVGIGLLFAVLKYFAGG